MTKRKKLTAAERRAQLIEIGLQTFAERGFDATTVEEIASRAGVSKPILYEHFGGKEGLYGVIVEQELQRVVRMIKTAIEGGAPRELVEGAAVAFLTYVRDHPQGFQVLTRDSPPLSGTGAMAGLLSLFADEVTGLFAGSFAATGHDPRLAPIYAQALVGMVTYVGQWWRDHPDLPVEVVASHLSALAWAGLRQLPKVPDDIWTDLAPKA